MTVAGIITALTSKTTKNDERMAFFTLEDRYAEMECIVFPKTLTVLADAVRIDAVVRVTGTLSVREDEPPKVIVQDCRLLEENDNYSGPKPTTEPTEEKPATPKATEGQKPKTNILPERARIVYLRVPDLEGALWKKVKTILEIFEGSVPVSVYDSKTGSYHKQELGFDSTPFTVNELIVLLGAENVVLK